MNKNQKIILAVLCISIAIVASVALLLPYGLIQMFWKATGPETGSVCTVTVTAYKDGLPVSETFIAGAFSIGETLIDSFKVLVTWDATGTGVEWDTFVLEGAFRVGFIIANIVGVEYETTFGENAPASGSWSKTLWLGTDICLAGNIFNNGWKLEFKTDIIARIQDSFTGETLVDELPSFVGTVTVSYVQDFHIEADMDFWEVPV